MTALRLLIPVTSGKWIVCKLTETWYGCDATSKCDASWCCGPRQMEEGVANGSAGICAGGATIALGADDITPFVRLEQRSIGSRSAAGIRSCSAQESGADTVYQNIDGV